MGAPQEITLLQRTKALLAGRLKTTKLVDIASGSGLEVAWLSKFHHDKITNPGVNHVQALHDYLVGIVEQ